MSSVLNEICQRKLEHVRERMTAVPLATLEAGLDDASPVRGFARAIQVKAAAEGYGLICEIKKASPSKGLIREDFDPAQHAMDYTNGGAACLSVLTDEPYFMGKDQYLVEARAACSLPVLRKDFMLEPYQVVEARVLGADCILIIMAALDDAKARALASLAQELGMDVLVEVHDREELLRAYHVPCEMIGINNRNLKTLEVSLSVTEQLAPEVPSDRLLICESGLGSRDELERMTRIGANGFLIGESLMRQADVVAATRALLPSPLGQQQAAS